MQKIILWLGQNRLINLLMAASFYMAVVVFHDEVTTLAIRFRRLLTVETYNLVFTLLSVLLFSAWLWWIYRGLRKKKNYSPAWLFLSPTILLILVFFVFMQTYAIEAIHFVQYAILALLLFPLIGSYGATVFWSTVLGMLDELYQFIILTPDFEYFDFNDILLNLLGAGLGMVTIFLLTGYRPSEKTSFTMLKVVVSFVLIITFTFALAYLTDLIRWYPGAIEDQHRWFSINRIPAPGSFWTEAYKGKWVHVVRPWEGIAACLILFTWYFLLDYGERVHFFTRKYRKA